MSTHADAATGACVLCGGPCLEPMRLPPIHPRYPFLPEEVIAMTQPAPEPVATPSSGRRGRRLGEDRMRRPSEDRSA